MTAPGAADGVVTLVHVLRHGEVHNPQKVLYGRLPGFKLSETGQAVNELYRRRAAAFEFRTVEEPSRIAA